MSDRNEKITSPANPRIKAVLRLGKRSERERTGLMTIEGAREIARALLGGVEIDEVFVCPQLAAGEDETALLGDLRGAGAARTTVSRGVFAKMAYREGAGGIVAVARRREHPLDLLPRTERPLYLVIDRVEKPGNLGALFRSADGAGASGLIVSDPAAELSNPNVIRASLGTVFTLPAAVAPAAEALAWLKRDGVRIIAAAPGGEKLYTDVDLTLACAIVLGSEDRGLGSEWLKASDVRVTIPMRGTADSLNVSAAAAIVLYEALRQRAGPA